MHIGLPILRMFDNILVFSSLESSSHWPLARSVIVIPCRVISVIVFRKPQLSQVSLYTVPAPEPLPTLDLLPSTCCVTASLTGFSSSILVT